MSLFKEQLIEDFICQFTATQFAKLPLNQDDTNEENLDQSSFLDDSSTYAFLIYASTSSPSNSNQSYRCVEFTLLQNTFSDYRIYSIRCAAHTLQL